MEILEKYLTILFNVFCFILLGYTVGLQVQRYFRNEDVSTISFTSFKENEYPTYTICLEDNFNGDLLKYNRFQWDEIEVKENKLIPKSSKNNILEGKEIAVVEKTKSNQQKIQRKPVIKKIRIDAHTIKPETMKYFNGTMNLNPQVSGIEMVEAVAKEKRIVKEAVPDMIVCSSSNDGFGNGDAIPFNDKFLIYPHHFKGLLMEDVPETTVYQIPKRCTASIDQNITYLTSEVSSLAFDNFTINVQDYLMDYSADILGANHPIGWIDGEYRHSQTVCRSIPYLCRTHKAFQEKLDLRTDYPFPFRISYQEPNRICFGPEVNTSVIKQHEYATLDLDKITSKMNEGRLESTLKYLRIYIHKQGQFIRNIGRDVANYASPDLLYDNGDQTYGSKIAFFVSQVTLLRSRHDAIDTCDRDLKNEDMMLLISIVKKVGCVPSYWKTIVQMDSAYPICNISKQYSFAYGFVSNITKARKLFNPPCEQMIVVSYIQKEQGRKRDEKTAHYLDFEFIQGSELFQEIQNIRDFGTETCWSGIGGFIGMIVGYPLIQAPSLFFGYIIWLLKLF